jgi:plasmid stabilization system protein ParE
MNREIVSRRIARREFDEAVAWYENERPGLVLEFKAAVDEILTVISIKPAIFRSVRSSVRRAVLMRFPYSIHFLDEEGRGVVLAVFHASREPHALTDRP